MIKAQTVFVIGAGASVDFDFPTGSQLVDAVCTSLLASDFVPLYEELGFLQSQRAAFNDALYGSGLNSVDLFLERRQQFLEIGKAAMGLVIHQCEIRSNIFRRDANWMNYLFHRMIGSSLKDYEENRVSFITFNYDRVLDQYFYNALKESHGASDDEVRSALEATPIMHIHGRIAYLPWQLESQMTGSIPYRGDWSWHAGKLGQQNIKVVHEDISHDGDLSLAIESLKKAERIYFLGFGYGKTNLERLQIPKLEGILMRGTAIWMNENERQDVRRNGGERITFHDSPTCLAFMRDVVNYN